MVSSVVGTTVVSGVGCISVGATVVVGVAGAGVGFLFSFSRLGRIGCWSSMFGCIGGLTLGITSGRGDSGTVTVDGGSIISDGLAGAVGFGLGMGDRLVVVGAVVDVGEGKGVKRCQLNQASNPPEATIPVVMTPVGKSRAFLYTLLPEGEVFSDDTIFIRVSKWLVSLVVGSGDCVKFFAESLTFWRWLF